MAQFPEERTERRRILKYADAAWERTVRRCAQVWPAPRAWDADPFTLGVARSAERHHLRTEESPHGPYVQRDIDGTIWRKLRVDHRLLLSGEPSAGASRTAYESMARTFSTALVLALNPDTPESVQMLVEELEPGVFKKLPAQELVILWLDRIEQHLPD